MSIGMGMGMDIYAYGNAQCHMAWACDCMGVWGWFIWDIDSCAFVQLAKTTHVCPN